MGYGSTQRRGQYSAEQTLNAKPFEGGGLPGEYLNVGEQSREQIVDPLEREFRAPRQTVRWTTILHQRQLSRRIIEAITPSGTFIQRNLRQVARAAFHELAERTSGAADAALRIGMSAAMRASDSSARRSGNAAVR